MAALAAASSPVDVGRRVALGQAQPLGLGQRVARSRIPSSAIRVRMKLVVPLTMPITRITRSPASDSRSGRITGMAPATAAS